LRSVDAWRGEFRPEPRRLRGKDFLVLCKPPDLWNFLAE
jgi:hypothetical protein